MADATRVVLLSSLSTAHVLAQHRMSLSRLSDVTTLFDGGATRRANDH